MKIETPHIVVNKGEFAKTVLMPGDPLRAKYIAENFLEEAKLISSVRNIYAYTGKYKGKEISVMASGMGIPSIGIYSHELYTEYGVERIIRIGSAGALDNNLKLRDIVVGMGASTDSNYLSQYGVNGNISCVADYTLLKIVEDKASELGIDTRVGNLLSSDIFYNDNRETVKKWADLGMLAVEMEAAGLYANAMKLKKQAIAICTISNKIFTGEETTAEERETSFTEMMKLALEVGITY